jgi:hypothetical protein
MKLAEQLEEKIEEVSKCRCDLINAIDKTVALLKKDISTTKEILKKLGVKDDDL